VCVEMGGEGGGGVGRDAGGRCGVCEGRFGMEVCLCLCVFVLCVCVCVCVCVVGGLYWGRRERERVCVCVFVGGGRGVRAVKV
jgi:hypothetical protein